MNNTVYSKKGNETEMQRFVMNIPAPLHRRLQIHAVARDVTMRDLVVEALTEKLDQNQALDRALAKAG